MSEMRLPFDGGAQQRVTDEAESAPAFADAWALAEEHNRLLLAERDAARARVAELEQLINTPHTGEFIESVRSEAAHQIGRWGTEHDAGKAPADWFWLVGFLLGKALHFPEKRKHHLVSSAAALLNWYRAETGDSTAMRPGIEPPPECTGVTAVWCPIHGDCSCRRDTDGEFDLDLDNPRCPLHAPNSAHGESR